MSVLICGAKNMDIVYENHLNIGTYYMSMFKTVATYSANMVAGKMRYTKVKELKKWVNYECLLNYIKSTLNGTEYTFKKKISYYLGKIATFSKNNKKERPIYLFVNFDKKAVYLINKKSNISRCLKNNMGKDYSNKKYASLNEMRIATEKSGSNCEFRIRYKEGKGGGKLSLYLVLPEKEYSIINTKGINNMYDDLMNYSACFKSDTLMIQMLGISLTGMLAKSYKKVKRPVVANIYSNGEIINALNIALAVSKVSMLEYSYPSKICNECKIVYGNGKIPEILKKIANTYCNEIVLLSFQDSFTEAKKNNFLISLKGKKSKLKCTLVIVTKKAIISKNLVQLEINDIDKKSVLHLKNNMRKFKDSIQKFREYIYDYDIDIKDLAHMEENYIDKVSDIPKFERKQYAVIYSIVREYFSFLLKFGGLEQGQFDLLTEKIEKCYSIIENDADCSADSTNKDIDFDQLADEFFACIKNITNNVKSEISDKANENKPFLFLNCRKLKNERLLCFKDIDVLRSFLTAHKDFVNGDILRMLENENAINKLKENCCKKQYIHTDSNGNNYIVGSERYMAFRIDLNKN